MTTLRNNRIIINNCKGARTIQYKYYIYIYIYIYIIMIRFRECQCNYIMMTANRDNYPLLQPPTEKNHPTTVYVREKPGTCPPPRGDGICAEMCSLDVSCPGAEKCCANLCGHQCMRTVEC